MAARKKGPSKAPGERPTGRSPPRSPSRSAPTRPSPCRRRRASLSILTYWDLWFALVAVKDFGGDIGHAWGNA